MGKKRRPESVVEPLLPKDNIVEVEYEVTTKKRKKRKIEEEQIEEEQPTVIPDENSEIPVEKKKKKKNNRDQEEVPEEEITEPNLDDAKSKTDASLQKVDNGDADSCHLSEESDIDLEDTKVHKTMRKIRKHQIAEWDVNNVEYPYEKTKQAITDKLLSDAPLHKLFPRICNISADEAIQISIHKIQWTKGKFTDAENKILRDNWEAYLVDNHIPNIALLFGMFRYGESFEAKLKEYYRLFFVNSKLMLRLAKGLPNRRLQQIYQRARVILVGLKQGADFDDIDRKNILDLYKRHGEKYSRFCEKYGYNPKAARELIRNNLKNSGISFQRGNWSEKEVEKLKKVVAKIMERGGITSYDKISWAQVSSKMNRSDIQCRNKFYSKTVYQLMAQKQTGTECDQDFELAKLIALIRGLDLDAEDEIKWDFIIEMFGVQLFNALSSGWRQAKFKTLETMKFSGTPDFRELIDNIYARRVNKKYGHKADKMEIIDKFVKDSLEKL